MTKTATNVTIDEESVGDDLVECSIRTAQGDFCLECNLSLKAFTHWVRCDPVSHFGELRIAVEVGEMTYNFLIEERSTSVSEEGVAFTVTGRSKQALLMEPYSTTATDSDESGHTWQTANTTATAVISEILSSYCPDFVTVNWNVPDFTVYEDSLSLSDSTPADVISTLADACGAIPVVHIDGSLSIEEYSVTEPDTIVASYTDIDDIFSISESIDYPSGYNAVTITGYDTATASTDEATITAENHNIDDDGEEKEDNVEVGEEHYVRVYYFHEEGDVPTVYFEHGAAELMDSGTEEITEDVTLTWGAGSAQYTNTDGETEVEGDEDTPLATEEDYTYTVNYQDYYLRVDDEDGDYSALFYFEDKATYTEYSFTVGNDSEGDICSSLQVEWASDETKYLGDSYKIHTYNPTGLAIEESGNSAGGSVDFVSQANTEEKTEDITITDGEASLSYPYYEELSITFHRDDVGKYSWQKPEPTVSVGSTTLKVSSFEGESDYYTVSAEVTYTTIYDEYETLIPEEYDGQEFCVWLLFEDCDDEKSISGSTEAHTFTIIRDDDDEETDITITVKDYVAGTVIEGAQVKVGTKETQTTDANGQVSLTLSPGDHDVKITANGYLDSDNDDLDNDKFTVS